MESILNKICVLVTAAIALTLVPGFRRSESSLLLVRDRGTALLVFMLLGLAEQVAVGQSCWYNHRIVAVCSAGLLAGSGVGGVVALFVTWLAVACDGRPLVICGLSMLCGGLAGGWLHRRRPRVAQHPLTGFCLTATTSCMRDTLIFLCTPGMRTPMQIFPQLGIAPVLQGLGTALILAVVALIRDRDHKTEVAASAEVRALQARMNPHFLFSALNTLATLATVAPHEIPHAAGRLRHFLRASFAQADRMLISLEEELTVVRAYLDIESLPLGNQLTLEQSIDSGLREALIPPFSIQPLVENVMQHNLQSSWNTRRLRLVVSRQIGEWLEVIASDVESEAPSTEIEQVLLAEHPRGQALTLLHRRLRELYDGSFMLEVRTETGRRSLVTMRIPLQTFFRVSLESPDAAGDLPALAP